MGYSRLCHNQQAFINLWICQRCWCLVHPVAVINVAFYMTCSFSHILFIIFFVISCNFSFTEKMASSYSSDSISTRISRLEGLLNDDIHTSAITKDSLIDTLLLLYEECNNQCMIKSNPYIASFIDKCKYSLLCFMLL